MNPIVLSGEHGINVAGELYVRWGDKPGEYAVWVPDDNYTGYKRDVRKIVSTLNNHADMEEALRRVNDTLLCHGYIDADTPLHNFVRTALDRIDAEKDNDVRQCPKCETTLVNTEIILTCPECRWSS